MRRSIAAFLAAVVLTAPFPAAANPAQLNIAFIDFHTGVSMESAALFGLAERDALDHGANALIIRIDSDGGSVEYGLAIANFITKASVPTVCIVTERAQSMGFVILQACDVRLMTPDAFLMAHEPWSQIQGNRHEIIKRAILEKLRLDKISYTLAYVVTRRMTLSVKQYLAKIEKGDWVMKAPEALAVGAVDKVVKSLDEVEAIATSLAQEQMARQAKETPQVCLPGAAH